VLSFFAAIKRFWVGLFLGQRTFGEFDVRRPAAKLWTSSDLIIFLPFACPVSYSEDLARVMKNALLISQVGNLARDIESSDIDFEQFGLDIDKYVFEEDEMQVSARDVAPSRGLPSDFSFSSRRAKVDEILGAWEEPETRNDKKVSDIFCTRASGTEKMSLNSSLLCGSRRPVLEPSSSSGNLYHI